MSLAEEFGLSELTAQQVLPDYPDSPANPSVSSDVLVHWLRRGVSGKQPRGSSKIIPIHSDVRRPSRPPSEPAGSAELRLSKSLAVRPAKAKKSVSGKSTRAGSTVSKEDSGSATVREPPEKRQKTRATARAASGPTGSLNPEQPKTERRLLGGDEPWWEHQGRPAVYTLRDCLASYVSREAGRDKNAAISVLLTRAAEGDCRSKFDAMVGIFAQRSDERGMELVMKELVISTFIPAAKAAVQNALMPSQK